MTERKKNVGFRKWLLILVLILVASTLLWIFVSLEAAFLVSLLLLILALRIDARVLLVIALVLLVTCPFLQVLQQDVAAKWLAEFAYFFLVAGVFLLFADYLRLTWRRDEPVEEPPAADD